MSKGRRAAPKSASARLCEWRGLNWYSDPASRWMREKTVLARVFYRRRRLREALSVKNHTDVLIFHTGICSGASQIPLMAKLIPEEFTFCPVAQALRNRDSHEQRQARSAEKRVSAALRMAQAELVQ